MAPSHRVMLGYCTTLDGSLGSETKVKSWQLEVQEMKVKCFSCFSLCHGNMTATHADTRRFQGNMSGIKL